MEEGKSGTVKAESLETSKEEVELKSGKAGDEDLVKQLKESGMELLDKKELLSELEKERNRALLEKRKENKANYKMAYEIMLYMKNLYIGEQPSKTKVTSLFSEIVPALCFKEYIKQKEVKACRLVCKAWKEGIDKCIRFIYEHNMNLPRLVKYTDQARCGFSFPTPLHIQRFFEAFPPKELTGYPLFSRYLKIRPIQEEFFNIYWKMMTLFMRQYGQGIWRIYFNSPAVSDFRQVYDLFSKQVVRYTPNLRMLTMIGQELHGAPKVDPALLSDKIQKEPLPPLKYFEVGLLHELPLPFLSALLNAGRESLKQLELKNGKAGFAEILDGKVFKRLQVLIYATNNGSNDQSGIKTSSLGVANFPSLEEMIFLHTKVNNANTVLNTFQIVNKIGANLRHLTLSFMNHAASLVRIEEKDLTKTWLHLPKLETLVLSVRKVNVKNIDFLVPLKSLKEFKLTFNKVEKGKKGSEKAEKSKKSSDSKKEANLSNGTISSRESCDGGSAELIKYTGYANRMYDSNIWTVLPELKKLSIEVITIGKAPMVQCMDGLFAPIPVFGVPAWCIQTPEFEKGKTSKVFTKDGLKKYQCGEGQQELK